jgi:predicted nuclease with TOPRIM domain
MNIEISLVQTIIAILGSSGLTSVIVIWLGRKKAKAEANDIVSQTYERLLKNCMQEVERLKINNEQMQEQINNMRKDESEETERLLEENHELRQEVFTLKERVHELERINNLH